MKNVLVGTSSWSDKPLVDSGLFYPADVTTPAGRLHYYAERFPIVEADSVYYGLPTAQTVTQWVERTPPQFVFDVKAFRLFTHHQTNPAFLPPDIRQALGTVQKKNLYYRDVPEELRDELWQRFVATIEPLRRAGKLGVVLFQFPPWFLPSSAHFAHIEECRQKLDGVQLATEFRNKTWFEGYAPERTWRFLREHRLAHVVVDEPQGLSSSVPTVWEATCPDIAVVRLHGRNRETWERKGLKSSGDRFNYFYNNEELQALAEGVRDLSAKVKTVHVFFNNNYGDYAQRNAADFMRVV